MFEIAKASIAGRDKILPLKRGSNQDAVCVDEIPDEILVFCVCDGCGEQDHSEIGAKLQAKLLVSKIINERSNDLLAFRHVYLMLSTLTMAMTRFGTSSSKTVFEYFLATAIVGVMRPKQNSLKLYIRGDGYIHVYNKTPETDFHLIRDENNQPKYWGYDIASGSSNYLDLVYDGDLSEAERVVIATDGIRYIPEEEQDTLFFANKNFSNPDFLRRSLVILDRDEHSLHDDTTVVAIRRKLIE